MKQICFVCQIFNCENRGSAQIMNELANQIAERALDVEVKPYACFGGCQHGPNIIVYPQKNWYAGVTSEDLPEIVESLAGGPAVTRLDTINPRLKELVYALLDAGVT
jgi:(2Fe-2S) ferredoxin